MSTEKSRKAPGHYLPISKNMDTSRNNGGAKKKV